MAGRRHPVSWQREVLTDRAKAREKRLRALGDRESPPSGALTPARGLVTVFRRVGQGPSRIR